MNRESLPISVLIAHSDPVIAAGLESLLGNLCEFRVFSSRSEESGFFCSAGDPRPSADVVIADYESGMRVNRSEPGSDGRVLILTHADSEAKICYALAQGVRGYLLLGCSRQDLVAGVRSVYEGGVAVTPRVARRIVESLKQQAFTPKETKVLSQMMLGRSNKAIAREFGVAVGTVKTHVKSILSKLDAGNRNEAVAIARRRGILPDESEWQERRGPEGTPQYPRDKRAAVTRNGTEVQTIHPQRRQMGRSGRCDQR
jgi:DNA-binding NarL/FixJ family response regulator